MSDEYCSMAHPMRNSKHLLKVFTIGELEGLCTAAGMSVTTFRTPREKLEQWFLDNWNHALISKWIAGSLSWAEKEHKS